MKVVKKQLVNGDLSVYDISVEGEHHYILDNDVISHNTMDLFPKKVLSGGTGQTYSADNIFIIGRQQEKEGKEISGYNFVINVEKSRFVREKSKIPINVNFETGISKYSGLMDIALDLGFVTKPKNGWYARVNSETGEIEDKNHRLKNTFTKDFWEPILNDEKFQKAIENKFKIGSGEIMNYDDDDQKMGEIEELDEKSTPSVMNGEDYEQ